MARDLKRKKLGASHPTEQKYGKRQRIASDATGNQHEPHAGNTSVETNAEDKDEGLEDPVESGGEDIDEWGGIEDQATAVGSGSHRQSSNPKKTPTGEELRTIKEASNLYKSNSFKLQIDALLPNVRPKKSSVPPLERFLLSLHAFLTSLSSSPPQHPLEASRSLLKKGIAVPYPQPLPSEETNWKVAFEKPSEITLVGSWATGVSVKGKDGAGWGVDLAVEMPAALFQEKDYLNARFFHKKAFYLASLASAITKADSGLDVDASYDSVSGDTRLTTLILRPRADGTPVDFTKLNAYVRLIPTLPKSSPIALQRLSPAHSNIRIGSSTTDLDHPPAPTPVYNTALLTSLTPCPHLLSTHATLQEVPSFRDALTLLRVWANQRGYCAGSGSPATVVGFEGRGAWWAALLSVLVVGQENIDGAKKKGQRNAAGRGLSSYQLFRAALDFLSRHNFVKEPVFVRSKDGHRFAPEEYISHHEAVFIDSSSTINLLSGIPLSSLDLIRHDARLTLDVLDNSLTGIDPFSDVFLKDKRDLHTRFDVVLRVNMANAKPLNSSLLSTLDYGSPTASLLHSLCTVLRKALGNRAKAIAVLTSTTPARPLSQAHPSPPSSSYLHIGLHLEPAEALRLVDRGPSASDSDPTIAQRFRDFWGDKAELRRFKDGRIEESVLWDVKNSDERGRIPSMIVRHVLERHFGLDGQRDVHGWQAEFDDTLRIPETVTSLLDFTGVQTGFKGAIGAYDTLVKDIKGLDEEIPLSLLNVSPACGYLRYTSVFAPIPLTSHSFASLPPSARHVPTMDIILQFERSARWPDDLAAIQKMKLAFFERIGSALMSKISGLKARVVVSDGVVTSDIIDQATLEIITPQGWAFSASIWHDREATLLSRLMGAQNSVIKRVAPKQENDAERRRAFEAFQVYTRRFIHAPRHHRAISALCHRFPAFAGTVRLVKRWLASHWVLGGHVTEEAVELLCASVFVGDGKALAVDSEAKEDKPGVPGSKELGFARVVLFLKDWKWESGLFVPVYGGQPIDNSDEQLKNVSGLKAGAAPGVWVISTDVDLEGHMWTSGGPAALGARRIKFLAKGTWECMQSLEKGSLDAKTLFIHPTEDYDFLIRLDPTVLCRYYQNVKADSNVWSRSSKYANLTAATEGEGEKMRVGFDPGRVFYDNLRRIYAGTMELFFDPFGGTTIGGVWDPSIKDARPFRVLAGYSSIPLRLPSDTKTKKKDLVSLNESSILAEIQRLGEGLIKSIDV